MYQSSDCTKWFLATLRRNRCGGESAKHFAFESKTICRRLGVSNPQPAADGFEYAHPHALHGNKIQMNVNIMRIGYQTYARMTLIAPVSVFGLSRAQAFGMGLMMFHGVAFW